MIAVDQVRRKGLVSVGFGSERLSSANIRVKDLSELYNVKQINAPC